MGSEVEMIDETTEEFNDVENTVFVAVGKNVKESKSLILWVLQCFDGIRICLLHIHQPAHLITLLDDKLSAELELEKMHTILNQYNLILSQAGVQTCNVWIEADNIETGIVQTITQYDIRLLVMGAATSKLYSKDMLEPKSKKTIYVCQQAPKSCQILIVCKGHLTLTRSMKALSPSPAVEETRLSLYHDPGADMAVENSTFEKNMFSPSTSTHLPIDDDKGNGLNLNLTHESEDQLVQSLSAMVLKESQGLSHDKLVEYAITDAKNSKQKAFEESIKRWRAEEDLNEALHKAEVSENLCTEENKLRKEMETILVTKNQEIKTMKSQQDQFIKELEMVKLQKPELVDQISKARDTEKELEEKIIQAVNLLITFKERRDNLQNERDNARAQINKLAKYIKNEDNYN